MLSVIRILQFEYEARGIGATKDRQSGRCRANSIHQQLL